MSLKRWKGARAGGGEIAVRRCDKLPALASISRRTVGTLTERHPGCYTQKKKMAQRLSPQPQFGHFRTQKSPELHVNASEKRDAK